MGAVLVVVAWFHHMPVTRTLAHFDNIDKCIKQAAILVPTFKAVPGVTTDYQCRQLETLQVSL